MKQFSLNSTVGEVKDFFGPDGRLLFPVDRPFGDEETLQEISNPAHYIWYSNIKADETVNIVNYLAKQSQERQIFFPIYSERQIQQNPRLADTGLYFFKGQEGKPFAINNAGGGFAYVAAMQDSFPAALTLSQHGLNAFALIYRPEAPYQDLARAIVYIEDHAQELGVDPHHYSLWGGSAGARMAAELGNRSVLLGLTGRHDIPQADAVIMEYTGYAKISADDAPTFVAVGDSDWIADWRVMKQRTTLMQQIGIPTEFHVYHGLQHGFGLGAGTVAEGWINQAIYFWQDQLSPAKQA